MANNKEAVICEGTIESDKIYNAHTQIKTIVEAYKTINTTINNTTRKVNDNWVGEGNNEFQSQYKLLISKIDDFGDTLQEMYEALVKAEADYATADNDLGIEYSMSIGEDINKYK